MAAASMSARGNNYVSDVRETNRKVWDGINRLVELQREWNALDYGNTLGAGIGTNDGILAASVGSVVFDTTNALVAVLNAGSATNMAKLL